MGKLPSGTGHTKGAAVVVVVWVVVVVGMVVVGASVVAKQETVAADAHFRVIGSKYVPAGQAWGYGKPPTQI